MIDRADASPSGSASPLNVANFLNVADPTIFPAAFAKGEIAGEYARQHMSDLVRWPLLLKYGGVYADVGMLQIGDVERLWNATVGDPASRFEVLSYEGGNTRLHSLTNYFLAAGKGNPLFARCHRLLLALWAEGGGRTSTEGMHASALLRGVPLMGGSFTFEEGGRVYGTDEVSRMLTDYIIQGQVMNMVMNLVDEEDGWNGPEYVAEHVYGIEFMVGAQLINDMTDWNGQLAFDLMSLPLPAAGEVESAQQKQAREIVGTCLQKSFGFKLAHGLILRVLGETLGTLWKKHEGSDDVPGTYAHWLRHATTYWNQDAIPPTVQFELREPLKRGPLLRAM